VSFEISQVFRDLEFSAFICHFHYFLTILAPFGTF
jgi:hypothetical protein